VYRNKGPNSAVYKYISFSETPFLTSRQKIYLKIQIRNKYKIVDSLGMNTLNRKSGSGRPKKDPDDIDGIIEDLTEEQLKKLAKRYIEIQRKNNNKKKETKSLGNFYLEYSRFIEALYTKYL
jgi:hypothetical protein